MSRGYGAVERRLLDTLIQRRDHDCFSDPDLRLDDDDLGDVRARWRWYTIDLLNLVEFGAPRSARVSLHRAVHGLHRARRLQIETACPYDQPFGAFENPFYGDYEYYYEYDPNDEYVGGFDLSELNTVDPRWPHRQGRCLWFRLSPPSMDLAPDDDQMYVLEWIGGSDEFVEFTQTRDRVQAWNTPFARLLRWLFCGFMPGEVAISDTGQQYS
jgi:hypothetical protein